MPRRKPPSRAAKKAAAARAVEKKKAKFWVPPSLAKDGGTSKPTAKRKAAKPKPKFWTPQQLGLEETLEKWEGGAFGRPEIEHVGKVRLAWYGHGDSEPGGLCVVGLPGHEERIAAHVTRGHPLYNDDPLLREIDPMPKAAAVGWCRSCDSAACDGVKWAVEKLLKRNPLPF